MNQILEMERLNRISCLLSDELGRPDLTGVPEEVADTLRMVRSQMRDMPAVIEDLQAARREFAILDKAIDRVLEIVREASALPEEDQAGRDRLEEELVRLARIVAQVAGRREYEGPKLSVRTRANALGSQKVLKYLGPVKNALAGQLREQTELIVDAVLQTVDFLEKVAEAYPRTASEAGIPDLLRRVEWIRDSDPAVLRNEPEKTRGLH